jgi:hypothetical protein
VQTPEAKHLKLVNRVDRLTIDNLDVPSLHRHAQYNKLMNSFVLRILFHSLDSVCVCKVTLQVFVTKGTAMCFTCNFSVDHFHHLFSLLKVKYGLTIKQCSMCTSVWSYSHWGKIGNLAAFYNFMYKECTLYPVFYHPELFACVTILLKAHHCTVRVFHTGNVVLLGIRSSKQVESVVHVLNGLMTDFVLIKEIFLM